MLSTGNIELLKELLSRDVEVDSQSDAGTPLIWAAGHGQQDAVKVLLEHHANVISCSFFLVFFQYPIYLLVIFCKYFLIN